MAMPCTYPDYLVDMWLDLVWASEREDEFGIIFWENEETLDCKIASHALYGVGEGGQEAEMLTTDVPPYFRKGVEDVCLRRKRK